MLPTTIVDCHHHFLAPDQPYHALLGKLGAPAYTAAQYLEDSGSLPITDPRTLEGKSGPM